MKSDGSTLAQELGTLPNKLSIEGHTDSQPYSYASASYSNWELSTDLANAARRVMQAKTLPRPFQPPHLAHRAIHRKKQ